MSSEQKVWGRILENFSPGKIGELEKIEEIDAKEGDFINVIKQVDNITKQGSGVVLPEEFFLDLSSRTLRKYLEPLKWRRVKSKKQAMDERITPYKLFQETKEKIRMDKYYGGTGWRGLSDRRNKNFLLYSWLEGWELASLGRNLISIRRYDMPEELKIEDVEERARISREISKLTTRRINLETEIMKKGGKRTGKVPSRTRAGHLYKTRMDGLPVNFWGSGSKFHYASWFDLTSIHNCEDKRMFMSYSRPKEEFFCAHDIAFLIASHKADLKYNANPSLVFTPFPKPNEVYLDSNKRYRKMVFKRVGNRRVPINKIDREGLIFCKVKATDAKFF